jgi:hypothetical protein
VGLEGPAHGAEPDSVVGSLERRTRTWAEITRQQICAGEVPGEAEAILEIATWDWSQWWALVEEYERRIEAVGQSLSHVAPWLDIEYERLTDRATARDEVQRLVDFVGQGKAEVAMRAIRFKE